MSAAIDPSALRRIEAYERDYGVGLARLPWASPREAARSLEPSSMQRLATFQARLRRAWLGPSPQRALAEAFADADPASRIAVYPGAPPGGPRWQLNTIGGALTDTPIKGQERLHTYRQYNLHGTDPFANQPVLTAPALRANTAGYVDPTAGVDALLEPNHAPQQLRMVMYDQRDVSLFMGWYRDAKAPRYTVDDHALLFAMRPALQRWHRLAKVLGPQPLGDGTLHATLAVLSQPALLVHRNRIIYTNQLGRLRAPEVMTWLRSERPAGFATTVPLAPGGISIELVLPVVAAPRALEDADLAARFGLTPTEARLAMGLARGESLRAVATDLVISYETARTHLKRIYDKVGVNRQAELVTRVLGR